MTKKVLAVLLAVVMLCGLFSGCTLWGKNQYPKEVTIEHDAFYFAYPDNSTEVLNTLEAYTTVAVYEEVTIDEVVWGRTDFGWVVLNADYSSKQINKRAVVLHEKCWLMTNPTDQDGIGSVEFATEFDVTEITADGNYVKSADGWLDTYGLFLFDYTDERTAYGVIYGEIGELYTADGCAEGLDVGARFCFVRQYVGEEETRAMTDHGYLFSLKNIYIEGTTGEYSATGVADVRTKMNVRQGPSSDYEIVGKYAGGEAVDIYEQLNINGEIWGYTDLGWVFMDLIKITSGSSLTGNTGSSGNTGNTGSSGNTGNTGNSGNTGNTGSTGQDMSYLIQGVWYSYYTYGGDHYEINVREYKGDQVEDTYYWYYPATGKMSWTGNTEGTYTYDGQIMTVDCPPYAYNDQYPVQVSGNTMYWGTDRVLFQRISLEEIQAQINQEFNQ